MIRKLMLISLTCMILGILLGPTIDANGAVTMTIAAGVKQDPAGGFTNSDLNGRYYFRRLGILDFEKSYREAETCYGYIDFNGAGSWAGQVTCFDSDGTSDSIPSSLFNGTYSVNTNGSFTWIFDEDIYTGHISSNKNLSILSGGNLDDNGHFTQDIITALRISDSPLSLSDLNGTWRYRDFELRDFENTNVNATTCSLLMVFNNGNWNASAECLDSDGSTDTAASVSGTYVINGNAFDLYESGYPEVLVSAYLSKDKNTFIFTRASFLENEFFKGIAIKEGAKKYTNADLSGTYFMHMMNIWDIETNDRGAEIIRGTLTSDGAGNWTFTGQNFESDGTSASGTISGVYSVKSDGSFSSTVTSETPNSTLIGYLSGDNNIFVSGSGGKVSDDVKSKAMPWIPLLLLDN
jgi:hypothetical protein